MRLHSVKSLLLFPPLILFLTSCSGGGGGSVDSLFGGFSDSPILTSIPDQIVAQTALVTIDINNIRDGQPGTDADMMYTCVYDTQPDGAVETGIACSSLPNSVISFSSTTGILAWTPSISVLGNYEFKISGNNDSGVYDEIFNIGVRLKFDGIDQYTAITGTSVTMSWIPNAAASGYQVYSLNSSSGLYELFTTITPGSSSGAVISGLAPNTSYTFRVQALDSLGSLDGNVVSRSCTTTTLTRFSMTPATVTTASGSPVIITAQAFNNDNSPQTVGGITVTPQIESGTSTGTFSGVTDNNNGTYTFTFNPIGVGTPAILGITTNLTFFLNNTTDVTVVTGAANSSTSNLSIGSNTVISGQSVTLTATIRDANNNPITSGSTITFNQAGGTSTGTFSGVSNAGAGVYTTTFTGVTAGTARTITVLVNGVPLSPAVTISVLPGPAFSATSTLAVASSSVSSGQSSLVTATLRDLNNNLISSGVLVTFNKSGGTSTGAFSSVVNVGGGVFTTEYSGLTAGTSQTLTISVDGVALSPSVTIQVVPGAPVVANSTLTASAPTVVSGNFVTVTGTLRDINNNPVETGITVSFSKSGGTSTGTFNSVTNAGLGAYNIRYTGVLAGTSQDIKVLVNGVDLGLNTSIAVLPGVPSASTSTLSLSSSSVASGSGVLMTATLRDDASNLISSGYTVAFSNSGGTSTGTIGAVTSAGSGQYTATYTGVNAGTAQTIGINVDSVALGVTRSLSVTAGTASSVLSTLTSSGTTMLAGQSINLTFTLRDTNSNPISTGYVVSFVATGGTSTGSLSAVTNQGNGSYTATYTGDVAGSSQTLQALVDMAGFGPTVLAQVLVGPPVSATSSVTITSSPVASNSSAILSATVRDIRSNPITNQYAITFDAVGGTSVGDILSATHIGSGVWQTTYTAQYAGSSQTVRVLADGAPISGLTGSIQVIPGSVNIANSTFSISTTTVQSGAQATLTAALRDTFNNRISAANVTINKDSVLQSDGTIAPAILSESPALSGNYSATYSATQMGAAQNLQLVVNSSPIIGMNLNVTVSAGPPTQMLVSRSINATNPIVPTECVGPIQVTLKDVNNNTTSSTSAISVALTSLPWSSDFYHTGTIFSDAACSASLSQLDFGISITNTSFYYKNYSPVTFDLTLDAPPTITDSVISMYTAPTITWLGVISTPTQSGSGSFTMATELSTSTGTGFSFDAYDLEVVDDEMYVSDRGFNRIVKYDMSTNPPTYVGWVGGIASTDGLSAACASQLVGEYTANWCKGGKSINTTLTNSLNFDSLNGMSSDATYIYVSVTHRVWRIRRDNGQLDGWIGWATGTGTCSVGAQAANAPSNGWCPNSIAHSGGANGGQFNTPSDVTVMGGYLYIADSSNNRIQRWTTSGVYSGWIGRMSVAGASGVLVNYPSNNPADCTSLGAAATVPWYTTQWCMTGTAQALSRTVGGSAATITTEGFSAPNSVDNDGTYLYIYDTGNSRLVRIIPGTLTSNLEWLGRVGNSVNNPILPAQGNGNYTNTWSTAGYVEGNSSDARGYASAWYHFTVGGSQIYAGQSWSSAIKIDLANGQNARWTGRVATTPAGGVAGCSSSPAMSITPGWCAGGGWNRASTSNGGFGTEVRSAAVHGTFVYFLDRYNARISKHNASTGAFVSWMGGGGTAVNRWTVTQPVAGSQTFASRGLNDFGFQNNFGMSAIVPVGDYFYINDSSSGRIKRYNSRTGEFGGWTGRFSWTSGTILTGGENCLGIVDGVTPEFCFGGYRPYNDATHAMHMYNNPMGIATDGTYYYVAQWSSPRIDRYLISNSGYTGWTGRVNATPTDGVAGCTSRNSGDQTDGWCIGGSSANSSSFGGFNDGNGYLRGLFWDSSLSPSGKLLALDSSRLHIINQDGTFAGVLGHVSAAGATDCTVTNSAANQFCTFANAAGGGTAVYGGLSDPYGVWADSSYIYVTDTHGIRRFTKLGEPAGLIGRYNAATGFSVTGNCAGSTFAGPLTGWCNGTSVGIALGANSTGTGNGEYNSLRGIWGDSSYLYAADINNHRVVRINKSTGAFAGWKGVVGSNTGMTGSCLGAVENAKTPGNYWCMGGTAKRSGLWGGFDLPTGLYVDSSYVVVVDSRNNRIMQIPKLDGP